jgi:glyoxylase-like metal-dependent hydrolase (beta-lactamase superfamily II)
MDIHFLNCFTCNARVPAGWRTGTLCLLIETAQGPVLVDTGLGLADYAHPPAVLRAFRVITVVPMDPQQAAVRQLASLGYAPGDVRHIVLTHMHFDHCGGLPDFPHARVHLHRREYDAFTGRPRHWLNLGYVHRHLAHGPSLALYEGDGERWFDWPAVRLPFDPEIWLVSLFGHSPGHCGVAVQIPSGWHFHVGDAAPIEWTGRIPAWAERAVTGTHGPRLRAFRAAHPEIRMTTGHMGLEFFARVRGSDSTL